MPFYGKLVENPELRANADVKAFEAQMEDFEKAYKKYDGLRAEYDRKVEAFHKDTQAWLDIITRFEDLGRNAAAELFPRRGAVIQTAVPAQRIEKNGKK